MQIIFFLLVAPRFGREIGSGLLLMRYGSTVFHASWLAVLPGAVLAGIGLGLTNTPLSNTTTASVSSDRAGMASGAVMLYGGIGVWVLAGMSAIAFGNSKARSNNGSQERESGVPAQVCSEKT